MKQVTVTVYEDGTVVVRRPARRPGNEEVLFSGRLSLLTHFQLNEAVKRVVGELRGVLEGMEHNATTALFISEGEEKED